MAEELLPQKYSEGSYGYLPCMMPTPGACLCGKVSAQPVDADLVIPDPQEGAVKITAPAQILAKVNASSDTLKSSDSIGSGLSGSRPQPILSTVNSAEGKLTDAVVEKICSTLRQRNQALQHYIECWGIETDKLVRNLLQPLNCKPVRFSLDASSQNHDFQVSKPPGRPPPLDDASLFGLGRSVSIDSDARITRLTRSMSPNISPKPSTKPAQGLLAELGNNSLRESSTDSPCSSRKVERVGYDDESTVHREQRPPVVSLDSNASANTAGPSVMSQPTTIAPPKSQSEVSMKQRPSASGAIPGVGDEWREKWQSQMKTFRRSQLQVHQRVQQQRRHSTRHQSCLRWVVKSRFYEFGSAALILANGIFIGWQVQEESLKSETEYIGEQLQPTDDERYKNTQHVFCLLFVVELVLRMVVDGKVFIKPTGELWWNLFDVFIVLLGVIESILTIADSGSGSVIHNLSMLRLLRLLRIVRVLRIIRVMRFFRELRMMVFSILGSLRALLWLVILLIMVFYVFGVTITEGATVYGRENGLTGDLKTHFGTLFRTLLTLYKAMSSGINWGEMVPPLQTLPQGYWQVYVVYITFSIFVVVNVATAVFVETALQSAQVDKEVLISEEKFVQEERFMMIHTLFEELDVSGSGFIRLPDFERRLLNPDVESYFNALGLDITYARTLFLLLDLDQNGVVDIDEFIFGVRRLKSEAKSLDLGILQYEMKWLMFQLSSMKEFMIKTHFMSRGAGSKRMTGSLNFPSANPDDWLPRTITKGYERAPRAATHLQFPSPAPTVHDFYVEEEEETWEEDPRQSLYNSQDIRLLV